MTSPKPQTNFICRNTLYFLFFIFLTLSVEAQQKAFPTAYGGGAYASGGRGGNVYHVTRLDDTYTNGSPTVGTFRWATQQPRPATVVFDVSGTIQIVLPLTISGQDLTIAGQSAPQGGITITNNQTNAPLSFSSAKNLILRYFRVRMQPRGESWGMRVYGVGSNGGNMMLDHLSLSYSGDEVFDMRGESTQNVTFQRGLIAEGKTGCLFGDGDYANNSGLFTYNNSFLTSLFVLTSHRTPNIAGAGRHDVINNVVYDWKYRLTLASSKAELNHINNYYFMGGLGSYTYSFPSNPSDRQFLNQVIDYNGPVKIHTKGNVIHEDSTDPNSNNNWMWTNYESGNQWTAPAVNPSYFQSTMMPLIGATPPIMTALEASVEVPENAGANKFLNADGSYGIYRDANDTDYINIVRTDTPEAFENDGGYIVGDSYEYPNAVEKPRYLNFVASISSTPINSRQGGFYSSNPHIPEIWFQNNVPAGQDHNDIAPSGYTWLEEYLNGVDGPTDPESVNANAGQDVSICEGNNTTLTATGGATYLWSTGATTASISVSPNSTATYTVTAYDATGTNSDTDDVIVTVNPLPTANAGQDVTTCRGTAVILTASGGGSYLWSNGATTASITVNPNNTTTYTVEVTQNGCTATDEVVVTIDPLPSVNAGTDVTINLGQSVTLDATGADSYIWNTGASGPTINVSPSLTTTYTVTGTNADGCINSDTVIVTVIDTSVTANAGSDVSICDGNSTTLTATGGSTYLWSNGETTASITVSPSSTTTYTVTVYDATGINSDTDEVEVTINPSPNAYAGTDVSTCQGTSVTLTATGGESYLWSNGATSASIAVNPNNTSSYTVEVTQNGCTATDEVVVTVDPLPSVNAGTDVTINLGQSVTLDATGADSYIWNTGATGPTINVSPSLTTTYTVTGTNAEGCLNSDTIIVTVIDTSVTVNAGSDVSICEGNNTTLTATGGSTYLWNNGETSASITVSPNTTTTYSVTAYDATGTNSDTDDVMVAVTPSPTANAGQDVITCRGTAVTLTASGGGSYLWSNGATSASITVNPNNTRTYTVEVTQNDCTASDEVVVTVNQLPSVNAGANVTINLGQSTTLNATGATTYTWNTGATGSNINVSPSVTTNYTVTGIDSNGCSRSDSVRVNVQTGNDVFADAGEDVTICEGNSTTLTATGGSTYLWSNGATTADITVSPNTTTTYSVTAFDATGTNSDTAEVTVSVNPLPSVDAGVDISICRGESVTLTATGAENYLWSNGATNASITVNPNNTTIYTVETTENGCSSTDDVRVTVNSVPVANAGADISTCRGTSVTLTATGGVSYLWSNGATSASITVNPNNTTTYTVDVTQNGCTATDDVRVTVNPLPSVNAGTDVTITLGQSVTLNATGANTYSWNTGTTGSSIDVSPSVTTTYTVTGTNANGCVQSDSVTVNVQTGTNVTANAGTDVSICEGNSTTLTATGGSTYLWSNGATTASITVSPNSTTTFTVTVYDVTGINSDSDDVVVTVNPLPTANAGTDVSTCRGTSVTLTATGGGSYLWSNGATTASITVNPNNSTTYTVEVTGNGCTATDDVRVTVNPLPSVNAGTDVTITLGQSVTLNATGANTYSWNTGTTGSSIDVSPSETTTYTVIGTNTNGCIKSDSVTVNVQTGGNVVANAGENVSICEGGSSTLTATGGSTYLWSNGATTAAITVSPNTTTTYSVTAYDATGTNSDTAEVTVSVNPLPTLYISPDFTINSGQFAVLYAFGAGSYSWSNGQTGNFILIFPTETTTYTLVGTNSNGCESTDSITITVDNGNSLPGNAGFDKTTCSGYSVTLSANGGDTYLWSTGETTQSINVTPNATTTYTVVAYTETAEITDEVIVNVNPNPVVNITNGGEVTILEGEYVTLSATGANRYEWNNGADLANIAVNPSTSTTYSVTGFIGDCSDIKDVVVNVVPAVAAFAGDDQIICRNEEITLTAVGGDEFLWNTGETTSSITVAPIEDTEYSVTVYNDLDYGTANVMVYVNDCSGTEIPEGSEGPDYFEFVAYPNPTSGELNIKISGLVSVSNIALYDLSGKMLFQESISNDTQQNFVKKLDLTPYADGLYLLRLVDGTHTVTKKIVIHK